VQGHARLKHQVGRSVWMKMSAEPERCLKGQHRHRGAWSVDVYRYVVVWGVLAQLRSAVERTLNVESVFRPAPVTSIGAQLRSVPV
jgi:hypothetical protein